MEHHLDQFSVIVHAAFDVESVDDLSQECALALLELFRNVGTSKTLAVDEVAVNCDWENDPSFNVWAQSVGFICDTDRPGVWKFPFQKDAFEAIQNSVRSKKHLNVKEEQSQKITMLVNQTSRAVTKAQVSKEPMDIEQVCKMILLLSETYQHDFGVGPFFLGLKQLIKQQIGRCELAVWKLRSVVFFQAAAPFADDAMNVLAAMRLSPTIENEAQEEKNEWMFWEMDPRIPDFLLKRMYRCLPPKKELTGSPTGSISWTGRCKRPADIVALTTSDKALGEMSALVGAFGDKVRQKKGNLTKLFS